MTIASRILHRSILALTFGAVMISLMACDHAAPLAADVGACPAMDCGSMQPVVAMPGPAFFPRMYGFPSGFTLMNASNPAGPDKHPVFASVGFAAFLDDFSIPFNAGDTFTGFQLELYGNGTVNVDLQIFTASGMGQAPVQIGHLAVNSLPTGWHTYVVPPFKSHIMAPGEFLFGTLMADGGGLNFGWMIPTFVHP